MKSFFKAKQAANLIHEFIEKSEKVPNYVREYFNAHIVICSDKQVIPLSSKLKQIEDDLFGCFYSQPLDVQIVDAYICMKAISELHVNISKRISDFIKNNKDMLSSGIPDKVSDNEYYEFLEDCFLDHYEAFYSADKDREHIIAILKRFRYKPQAYELIKQLIPLSELEAIENDYMFNFEKYKCEFYKYYYEFYIRSDNAKTEIADKLLALSKDSDKDYDGYTPYSVKFDIDFFKPVEHVMEELDDFRNAMYMMLTDTFGGEEIRDNSIKNIGYHLLKDYIRDSSGKVDERNNLSELFNRWQRYLEIHDMRKTKGYTWTQVRNAVNSTITSGFMKEAATVKNEYNEAVRLIESAAKGTFPY